MALYDVKPRFRQLLLPLADRLAWMSPDAVTLSGLLASVLALGCIALGEAARGWLLLVPVWLFVRIACNALDGLIAQRTGKARPFGEVLNEGVDRLSDLVLLLGLGLTAWASFSLAAWTTIAVLCSSYVGVLGKAVGAGREYGGVLGKADRMLWLGSVSVIVWLLGPQSIELGPLRFASMFEAMLAAFLPLALVTTGQRVARIHRRLQAEAAGSGRARDV